MNDRIKEKIKLIFSQNDGYATSKEITSKGINRYYIKCLEESEDILKMNIGLYKWNNGDNQYNFELLDVCKMVPEGVLCLTTALAYYNLVKIKLLEYEVAIERNRKIILPEYAPIKIIYFSQKMLDIGVVDVKVKGYKVKMFDMEKTICDCIRYRNKLDDEVVEEAMKNYIKKRDRDLIKLKSYGEIFKIDKILREYFDILYVDKNL